MPVCHALSFVMETVQQKRVNVAHSDAKQWTLRKSHHCGYWCEEP